MPKSKNEKCTIIMRRTYKIKVLNDNNDAHT